jgi:hypothetical protein
LKWSGDAAEFINKPASILDIDGSDNTIRIAAHRVGFRWWPVEYCDAAAPSERSVAVVSGDGGIDWMPRQDAAQRLAEKHQAEIAKLKAELVTSRACEAATRRQQQQTEREKMLLCNQINALEKQVADLKAERDRVGKTSQTGTRFAQLELD